MNTYHSPNNHCPLKVHRSRTATAAAPYHISSSTSRTSSYPGVRTSPPIPEVTSATGLAFDSLMLKHACVCGDYGKHEENPGRLEAIYRRLRDSGLADRCQSLVSRKATIEELKSCHSEAYSLLYGSNPKKLAESQINREMFGEHPGTCITSDKILSVELVLLCYLYCCLAHV